MCAEFTGDVEEEFETDIEIDFSQYTEEERKQILNALLDKKKYNFKDICVIFSGEVTIDVEPPDYY